MEEYPDQSESTRLRIQLHEERCKVEYLAKQNQMLEALNARITKASIQDHGDWRSKCNNLETELRAEINRLRGELSALAAENERLTRLLLDLSNAVHIHRANANTSKCDAEINRIVAEVDTIFDIQ